jgi:hypothetical protein
LVKRCTQGNNGRTVFAFRVSTRTGKPVDVDDVWKASVAQNGSPRLQISPKYFVLCPRVWTEIPDSRVWRSHSSRCLWDLPCYARSDLDKRQWTELRRKQPCHQVIGHNILQQFGLLSAVWLSGTYDRRKLVICATEQTASVFALPNAAPLFEEKRNSLTTALALD